MLMIYTCIKHVNGKFFCSAHYINIVQHRLQIRTFDLESKYKRTRSVPVFRSGPNFFNEKLLRKKKQRSYKFRGMFFRLIIAHASNRLNYVCVTEFLLWNRTLIEIIIGRRFVSNIFQNF